MTRLLTLLLAGALLTGCAPSHDNWGRITDGVKRSYEGKP